MEYQHHHRVSYWRGYGDGRDVYFADAARLLMEKEKGSIGMLQRYFKIGFNRAAHVWINWRKKRTS